MFSVLGSDGIQVSWHWFFIFLFLFLYPLSANLRMASMASVLSHCSVCRAQCDRWSSFPLSWEQHVPCWERAALLTSDWGMEVRAWAGGFVRPSAGKSITVSSCSWDPVSLFDSHIGCGIGCPYWCPHFICPMLITFQPEHSLNYKSF